MSFGLTKDILMDIFLGKGDGGQIIILSYRLSFSLNQIRTSEVSGL